MAHRSHAARRHADLAWITFGISDELRDRPGRNRRVHHHNVGLAADGRDRRDVAYEIEIEVVVKRRVPRVSRSNLQQRVAVRWRAHDRFGTKIAAGARPVLDDKRLTEAFRQPVADQAPLLTCPAARWP